MGRICEYDLCAAHRKSLVIKPGSAAAGVVKLPGTDIEMYAGCSVGTDFYADKLCLSVRYASSMIQKYSGKKPSDWIDEYVTTEAKALIRSSTLTFTQIADELNFESQMLFGKFFKHTTGLTPSEYRRGNAGAMHTHQ